MRSIHDIHRNMALINVNYLVNIRADHGRLVHILDENEYLYEVLQAHHAGNMGVIYLTRDRLLFLAYDPRSKGLRHISLPIIERIGFNKGLLFGTLVVHTTRTTYNFDRIIASDKPPRLVMYVRAAIQGIPLEEVKLKSPTLMQTYQLYVWAVAGTLTVVCLLLLIVHWTTSPEIFIADPNCDSAYPDFCIRPGIADLDCGDIEYRRFPVREPDPHRFDGNGDGIGCER